MLAYPRGEPYLRTGLSEIEMKGTITTAWLAFLLWRSWLSGRGVWSTSMYCLAMTV
jgi:hypothetical protein